MSNLPELHQKAVDLLDILQRYLPDKTGKKTKWNFEKAPSILHKVREIVLWGNSDNVPSPTGMYLYILVYKPKIYMFSPACPQYPTSKI